MMSSNAWPVRGQGQGQGEELHVMYTWPPLDRFGVTSCQSFNDVGPCPAPGAELTPPRAEVEHRPPMKPQRHHLSQPENHIPFWKVGSETQWLVVPSNGENKWQRPHFYIVHSMWLCTICWYPDGVDVWDIWYLAFSRRHEIKMYDSHSYLCFCDCRDKLHSVVLSSHTETIVPLSIKLFF